MNSLLSELMRVTATERVVLEQCKDFLSTLSAMQVSLVVYFIFFPFKVSLFPSSFSIAFLFIVTGQGL